MSSVTIDTSLAKWQHILELTPAERETILGPYQEYLERFGDDYLNRDLTSLHHQKPSQTQSKSTQKTKTPISHEERKLQKQRINQLQRTVEQLERKSLKTKTNFKILKSILARRDTFNLPIQSKFRNFKKAGKRAKDAYSTSAELGGN